MALPPTLSAAAAAALLPPGGRALIGGCTAEPGAVLDAVRNDAGLWRSVTLTGAFIPGVNDADFSAIGTGTRVETIFTTAGLRQPAGTVAHLPLHYSAFWMRLATPGLVDLVYLTVPPPRADGTVGFGLTADFAPAAIAAGARLVGVVNRAMPDTAQGPRLPLARFSAFVEANGPLPTMLADPPGPALQRIAERVTGLLRPGDTLQLGLGKAQTAVLEALARSSLSDLGYHAGMITPAILPLLRRGFLPRGVTTGVAVGDTAFYAALAGMPGPAFAPVSETHALARLAALPQFVAVNSVIEIDLSGQANAEAMGGRQVSGQGGLVDFLRGARASPGGRAVLVLAATAERGTQSRIVPRLAPGTPVSVARADVDIVVTEYGVARLADLSLAERCAALIAIAAPQHRAALRAASA